MTPIPISSPMHRRPLWKVKTAAPTGGKIRDKPSEAGRRVYEASAYLSHCSPDNACSASACRPTLVFVRAFRRAATADPQAPAGPFSGRQAGRQSTARHGGATGKEERQAGESATNEWRSCAEPSTKSERGRERREGGEGRGGERGGVYVCNCARCGVGC